MAIGQLRIIDKPNVSDARMIIGMSGWMDGGDVSTGTIEWLVRQFDAEVIAEIEP